MQLGQQSPYVQALQVRWRYLFVFDSNFSLRSLCGPQMMKENLRYISWLKFSYSCERRASSGATRSSSASPKDRRCPFMKVPLRCARRSPPARHDVAHKCASISYLLLYFFLLVFFFFDDKLQRAKKTFFLMSETKTMLFGLFF